jgi:hypothetical protein
VTSTNYFDLDKLLSTVVLARLLAKDSDQEIDILLPQVEHLDQLEKVVRIDKLNFIQEVADGSGTLVLKHVPDNIRDIKWEQIGDTIKLKIQTKDDDQIDLEDVDLGPEETPYSKIYTLGINSSEFLQKLVAPMSRQQLSQIKVIALHNRQIDKPYAEDNFIYTDGCSYAEAIYKYALLNKWEISQSVATNLLSGVYWRTNGLRNSHTSTLTMENAKGLIEAGASLPVANTRAFGNLNPAARKVWAQAMAVDPAENRVVILQIAPELAQEYINSQPSHPELTPFTHWQALRAGFILLPSGKRATEVLALTNDKTINLKKLFKDGRFTGDHLQARIFVPKPPEEVEKHLVRNLSIKQEELKVPRPVVSPAPKAEVVPEVPPAEPKETNVVVPGLIGQKGEGLDDDPLKPVDKKALKEIIHADDAEDDDTPTTTSFMGFGNTQDPLPPVRSYAEDEDEYLEGEDA